MSETYLKAGRLSDVIAAITTLGSYKFYKLDAAGWADRISGRQKSAEHWKSVFDEHPEFFRMASGAEKYSLVWRRQFPRNFNVDSDKEILGDHEVSGEAYDRISRRPLSPDELTSLISVAVNLHRASLDHDNSRRWWIQLVTAAVSFAGAMLGAAVS